MSAREMEIEKLRIAAMKASMMNVEARSIGGTTGLGIPKQVTLNLYILQLADYICTKTTRF